MPVNRKENRPDGFWGGLLQNGCFVSREIFIFKILERVHSLTEAFLGENIVFSRRTAESAIFNLAFTGLCKSELGIVWNSPPGRRSGFILCPSSRNLSECSVRVSRSTSA